MIETWFVGAMQISRLTPRSRLIVVFGIALLLLTGCMQHTGGAAVGAGNGCATSPSFNYGSDIIEPLPPISTPALIKN